MSKLAMILSAALAVSVLSIGSSIAGGGAEASEARAERMAQTASARLDREVRAAYGDDMVRRIMNIRTRAELIRTLQGLKKSPTAQALVAGVKLGDGPATINRTSTAGGSLTIDPKGLGCLNCIGVHCP